MSILRPSTIPFFRLITTLLVVLLPCWLFPQNNTPLLSLGGDISLEMVPVPGGTFAMGCTFEQAGHCAYDEKPEHQVSLKSFAIAKYEVTQKLWKEIMGTNPSRVPGEATGRATSPTSTAAATTSPRSAGSTTTAAARPAP